MLYTGRGDTGETSLYACNQRISKSSAVTEALGALDEINSFLGLVKLAADPATAKILQQVQQNLFIVQAEAAGAKPTITRAKVAALEKIINRADKELPPIKTFLVAGGTMVAARLDYARAMARRAERRVVAIALEQKIGKHTLAYLNRLSSLLYVLARLENHKSGIEEVPPNYN